MKADIESKHELQERYGSLSGIDIVFSKGDIGFTTARKSPKLFRQSLHHLTDTPTQDSLTYLGHR
jgi:hypothetical protein